MTQKDFLTTVTLVFRWVPQHHLNQDNSKNKLNAVFFFTKHNLEVYFIRNNISPEGEKN